MQYIVKAPKTLNAVVNLPASKSISNRALIISALAHKQSEDKELILPENLSDCDDTDVIIKALRDMPYEINIKAAGTAMRFMTAYLSVTPGEHIITGTERMKHRPIKILVDTLRSLGADITYIGEEGYPPLKIKGKNLKGGTIEIASNISSQYISALLMIAPTLEEGLTVRLNGTIASRPYIDLTLWIMNEFGAEAEWTGVDTIHVGKRNYTARPYYIENDWSASSYWYEMMALYNSSESHVTMKGLADGSRQGDAAVKYMFSLLGTKTSYAIDQQQIPTDVTLKESNRMLRRMDYDFTNQPDLAQTLVCTCLAIGMHFNFRGLASLKIKETDRIEALKTEMRKLGYVIYDYNDSELRWDGEKCDVMPDVSIDTYDDHRMAMAIAPMAIVLGEIKINNPEVVSKSYPHYWEDLKSCGFEIIEVQ